VRWGEDYRINFGFLFVFRGAGFPRWAVDFPKPSFSNFKFTSIARSNTHNSGIMYKAMSKYTIAMATGIVLAAAGQSIAVGESELVGSNWLSIR
jgi:hypothetical protein